MKNKLNLLLWISLILVSGCSFFDSSITGIYENAPSSNELELSKDGTYTYRDYELDLSNYEFSTDSGDPLPKKLISESKGNYKLEGKILKVDFYPYEFGVEPGKLFRREGGGIIEFIKKD